MPELETKRLFVAVFPPTHVVASLQAAVAEMAKGMPGRAIRWTRADQVHLTLSFLGTVQVGRIQEIKSALGTACERCRRHTVRAEGLGCFPNARRPRIIWAGLTGDVERLAALKSGIDERLAECGCVPEERAFHPHLTLGRIAELNMAQRKWLADELARERQREFGEWEVGKVELMESVLSAVGSVYSVVNSFMLEKA